MKAIEEVFNISRQFMDDPKYVKINYNENYEDTDYDDIINNIKEFNNHHNDISKDDNNIFLYKKIAIELILNSMNYCYWYGSYKVRPSNASATNLLKEINSIISEHYSNIYNMVFDLKLLDSLKNFFSINRYPMMEERMKHVSELLNGAQHYVYKIMKSDKNDKNVAYKLFEELITTFPGYGSDIFLKRASLFFLSLNRTFGWYEDFIKDLHIAADYQLPRILNNLGFISYSTKLSNMINNEILIPKHSIMECEIRAATILVCKNISEAANVPISVLDLYLWLKAKNIQEPFHLTITTDY